MSLEYIGNTASHESSRASVRKCASQLTRSRSMPFHLCFVKRAICGQRCGDHVRHFSELGKGGINKVGNGMKEQAQRGVLRKTSRKRGRRKQTKPMRRAFVLSEDRDDKSLAACAKAREHVEVLYAPNCPSNLFVRLFSPSSAQERKSTAPAIRCPWTSHCLESAQVRSRSILFSAQSRKD